MKVSELIEQLNNMNPDARVFIESKDADHFEIDRTFSYGSNEVYLDVTKVTW
jgi:hypothetical protein